MSQDDLGELMEKDGLGLKDPGEISQGRKKAQDAHVHSMSRHLRVPPEWFNVDDFERWISRLHAPSADEFARASDEAQVHLETAAALAELAEAQVVLARAQERLTHSGLLLESADNG